MSGDVDFNGPEDCASAKVGVGWTGEAISDFIMGLCEMDGRAVRVSLMIGTDATIALLLLAYVVGWGSCC